MSPLIEIRNLEKSFQRSGGGTVKPVDDISLTVEAEELVVLLGPSGCGKTTLLRCVAGLERPDRGEILINGEVVFSSDSRTFLPPERRNISMVFQSFALWPHMTVGGNVGYPLESRGTPRAEIARRVSEALGMVGVGNLAQQYPGRISGGQQQRVALARALASGSNVVLFDEPLSSIDAKVREQLRAELGRMQRELGFAGLYVTHDQAEAMELGGRIAVLNSGRVAALGPPRAVYENPPDTYVANFVGAANIWQGDVVSTSGEGATVQSDFGTFVVTPLPVEGARAGEKVSLMARPEALRLSPTRPENVAAKADVKITSRIFAGPFVQYGFAAGASTGRVWHMNEPSSEELQVGTSAWLCAKSGDLRIVKDSA